MKRVTISSGPKGLDYSSLLKVSIRGTVHESIISRGTDVVHPNKRDPHRVTHLPHR